MPNVKTDVTMVTIKLRIRPEAKNAFVDWQAKLNKKIAAFPGFDSLEILCPSNPTHEWVIVKRFLSPEAVAAWQHSKDRNELMAELKPMLVQDDTEDSLNEKQTGVSGFQTGVTEIFVTQVNPEKEMAYRDWMARAHQAEVKFPGFRGVYVQAPKLGKGSTWITLLQFDTIEHLEKWLASPERLKVLKESESMIASLDSHRVISPFAGWFSSVSNVGEAPPIWKQTMIVLLVLFPIVMFEIKFLSPILNQFHTNTSLATFIGNAISVTLVSWPTAPIAIWFLGWWLSPVPSKKKQINIYGTLFVFVLYLIEVVLLWHFI